MATSSIIADGYTADGFIEAVDRLHGSLSFKYRPLLPEQVDAIDKEVLEKPPREGHKTLRAAIAGQLVSWSEKEPITVENVRRLPYRLYNKLYRIIAGLMPSDAPPNAGEKADDDDFIRSLRESAETGVPVGAVRAAADAKN